LTQWTRKDSAVFDFAMSRSARMRIACQAV
jgi:hypothetical protein